MCTPKKCHLRVSHHFQTHPYTHTPKSLQCLRLTAIPNQNARHDPCPGTDLAKPLSPLETLALTSLDQTIMVLLCSIRFYPTKVKHMLIVKQRPTPNTT